MVLNLIQIANVDIYYFFCLLCLLQSRFHFWYLFNQNFKFIRYFQVLLTTLLHHQFSVLESCMFYQHRSDHKQKYFHYILIRSYPQLASQLCRIFITKLVFHHQWNQNWIILSLTYLFPKVLSFHSKSKHTFIY